jgi:hypothetical protein
MQVVCAWLVPISPATLGGTSGERKAENAGFDWLDAHIPAQERLEQLAADPSRPVPLALRAHPWTVVMSNAQRRDDADDHLP